ncbi:MAG: amino acid adenylation domain-containing protein, partial [Bacteroidota bacterium]
TQERLWFLDQLHGSTNYHLSAVLKLTGEVDMDVLQAVAQQLVERHEVLRTVYQEEEGSVFQAVIPSDDWVFDGVLEASDLDEQGLHQLIERQIKKPFDLASDYMLRMGIVEQEPATRYLILVMHHIASDGWSIPIFVREFANLYAQRLGQKPEQALPSLPVQFIDYALWERQSFREKQWDEKLKYWIEKLEDTPPIDLKTDSPRPLSQSTAGNSVQFRIDVSFMTRLQQLAQEGKTTLYVILLAIFKILLQRYSRQNSICVGTPVANRNLGNTENLIGYFVNTIALKSSVAPEQPFLDFVQELKTTVWNGFEHQEVPFEKIVKEVITERDLSRNPIFQVMFAFQNYKKANQSSQLANLQLETLEHKRRTTKFDLSCNLAEDTQGLDVEFEYSTALFRQESIERMMEHFQTLIQEIVHDPTRSIGSYTMLSTTEAEALKTFSATEVEYPNQVTVIDYFLQHAKNRPGTVALRFEGEQMTYAKLERASRKLAQYLLSKSNEDSKIVGICLERSFEMVVGLLAILRAGLAYVPIDPGYPTKRQAFLLDDTNIQLLLSDQVSAPNLHALETEVIEIDTVLASGNVDESLDLPQLVPTDLAYVIYTSGTTGRPKGVMNAHAGLLNRLLWTQDYFQLQQDVDVVLQKTTFSFDVSVWEFFWPLLAGVPLVISRPGGHQDNAYLAELIRKEKVTTLHFVPSMLQTFLLDWEKGESHPIKRILCSGEALEVQHIQLYQTTLGANIPLYNLYGPTEAAIDVSCWQVPLDSFGNNSVVSIGGPVSNTQLLVLNEQHQQTGIGIIGELFIAGAQLAKGYLNRPELTAERFKELEITGLGRQRLYKTGDLVRWLPNGTIEFIGRNDDQVKIRGNRIELGEIKHALAQVPHITQAEVVVKKDLDGRQLLLAYFTAKSEGLDKADLRERLQDQLPDYMIPHYFVQLESFPLTTNGKLDRKALPDIAAADIIRKTYEAPTNELESLLVQIWEAVLKQEQIGVNDNFFELGGDSIMVIQVVSRLKKHQYSLHPKDLFLAQTIRALAKTVREKKQTVVGEQGRLRGEVPLLPMQLDYLQLNPPTPSHFNQSILLEIDKDVDLASLKQAVAYLFDRHDALRMSFRRKGEQWIQEYGDFQGELISISLEGESAANWSSELELHCARYQSQLEIENGEVARFVFFETPAEVERARLFIVLHHLVTDGISWRVLLNDLESWTNVSDTRDAPPKATSYRQWGEALQHFAQHTIPEMEKRFWLETIAQKSTLPVDQKGSRRPKATIKGITIELERDLTELLLKEIHTAFNTDINDILLSALALALYHWTEQQTTVIGLEGHGREHIAEGIDITDTVGWFTSIFPVPLRVPEGYTLGTLIKATKEQLRKTPRKGLGFGCLKYYSDDPKIREQLRETPWEVTFNYLGSADNALQQTNQKLRPAKESMGAPIADDYPVPNKLEIHALLQAGSLKMYWNFSSEEYQEQTIEQLSQQFVEHLRTIVAYNIQQSDSHKTPSDFGLQDFVNYSELDRFLAQPSATNLQDIYRLSPLQEGLLFHALLDQDSISYREQLLVDFNPELDTKVFQQAWQALTEHHSILRSNIKTSAFDQPVQCVYHSVSLPFEVVDLGEVEDAEQFMDDYLEADRRQGLDLSSAPLFRICLFKHPAYCRMLLSFHHIILDGWSLPLMLKELLKHYDDLSIGKEIQVQQPDNYGDFIKFIQTQHAQSARQFWQQYLEGIEKASLLPFAERLTDQYLGNSIFSTEKLVLDPQRSEDLKAFAKQNHLTINTIIQGAWAFLLAKYTNTQDVLFGVTVAGRPAELDRSQQRLGLYINTIPLRIKVAAGEEVTKWLEQLQLSHAEARGFQYEPLNEIKKHTSLQEAFFDSLIVFENYPISEVVSAQSQLQIQNVQLREETHYLLSIIVVVGEQVEVRFKYNERLDIFYVRQIMAHFEQVIQSWVTNDRALLQNVEYLTPEERDQLLIGNGNLQVTYPQHRTLVQLFLEQAQKTPDHIALTFGEKHLTYQSLDRLSNKLAHHLIQQDHIQPEELVGIYQWHSEWLIITILGILKAGGAYVPIDPDYPQERTDYIKNDSACRIIIGEEWLTEFRANLAEYPETTPQVAVQAENLAYIIYTSGTTGKPKGVQVEHRNVVRLFLNQKGFFD